MKNKQRCAQKKTDAIDPERPGDTEGCPQDPRTGVLGRTDVIDAVTTSMTA